MFFIIQFHIFLLVVWWWIQYRWWKYNLRYQKNIIPVGLNNAEILYNLFETGDIILNRGEYQVWNHPMYYYVLYCSFSRAIFTHSGVLLKDPINKKLYIIHCSPQFKKIRDLFGDDPMPHAFIITDLARYVQQYKGTTLIRRQTRDKINSNKSKEMTELAQNICHEYKTNGYRFSRLGTLVSRFFGQYTSSTKKEVHCSEFAGIVLQKMGLIPDSLNAWYLVPDSFSIEKNPNMPGYEPQYFYIKQDLLFDKAIDWISKRRHVLT
jgi:hypothetical protein